MTRLAEARAWLERAATLVPWPDRVGLLSPPALVWKFLRFGFGAQAETEDPGPEARDPDLVALVADLARVLGRWYFRLEVRGVENVPESGAALLVGNHNGGLLPMDGVFAALAIADALGPERSVHALAHDVLFSDALLARYAGRLGIVRAGHGAAERVFDRGALALVYPGSDWDSFRAWRDNGKVILGGRSGFVRLALRARVPIVPVVSAGTCEQWIVLTRGDGLARLLRTERWARLACFPIVLALPWGLTTGLVPYLPLPAQTTVAFGPPMSWPDLGPEAADDPATVSRVYAEVQSAMQALLDELTKDRIPFLGAPRPH